MRSLRLGTSGAYSMASEDSATNNMGIIRLRKY